jgi:hypothetical protein
VAYSSAAASERVSKAALDLLDELRLTLLECLLVLKVLPDEADLDFVDLEQQVLLTHHYAKQAHRAAGLVNQGAVLNERWGECLSRPKAVFARHSAAVRQGAPRLQPLPMISDEFERRLWKLPVGNSIVAEQNSMPDAAHDVSARTAVRVSQESLGRTVANGWKRRHGQRQRRVDSLTTSRSADSAS